MDNTLLKSRLEELLADAGFPINPQYLEVVVPHEKYHDFCILLKTSHDLLFDYLISLTAVDWNDHFMIVCHITSTRYRHTLIVKTRLDDRAEPLVETVSDIWSVAVVFGFNPERIGDWHPTKKRIEPNENIILLRNPLTIHLQQNGNKKYYKRVSF